MDYAQVEEQFKQLKEQFLAGKLDEAAFKTKLNELMVQDSQGRWWMIGYETGEWYTHDGSAWVRAEPPRTASAGTSRSSVSPGESAQPGARAPGGAARKMGWGFWLGWVGSLVASIVFLVWISYSIHSSTLQGLILGGIAGFLQWLIMRPYDVRNAWRWILANVAFMLFVGGAGDVMGGYGFTLVLMGIYVVGNIIAGPLWVARGRRQGVSG
jgi:hypothetical protein